MKKAAKRKDETINKQKKESNKLKKQNKQLEREMKKLLKKLQRKEREVWAPSKSEPLLDYFRRVIELNFISPKFNISTFYLKHHKTFSFEIS